MRIENLHVGQIIKNYRELCTILGVEPKGSNNTNGRKSHHKEFDRYFLYSIEGRKYIIKEIYDIPKELVDNRKNNKGGNNYKYQELLSPKELSNEFDGYYVYRHILNDEVIYVGKGSRRRVADKREQYDVQLVDKEIIIRFDDENDALKFEEQLIQYYKSFGMCKFNADFYIPGKIEKPLNKKTVPKVKSAFEKLNELGYSFDEHEGWIR